MRKASIWRLQSSNSSTTYLSFLIACLMLSMTFYLFVLLTVSISHLLSVRFRMIWWFVGLMGDCFDIFFTLQIQKHRLLLQAVIQHI